MVIYVIYFTLPLTPFLFFVTVHKKASDFTINLLINVAFKLFRTAHRTSSGICYASIQTRLTQDMPTTHSEVWISTRILTYSTDHFVRRITHELVVASSAICHLLVGWGVYYVGRIEGCQRGFLH